MKKKMNREKDKYWVLNQWKYRIQHLKCSVCNKRLRFRCPWCCLVRSQSKKPCFAFQDKDRTFRHHHCKPPKP